MSQPTKEELLYWKTHPEETQQPNLIASVVVCLIFPITAVVLRVVCRRLMRVPLLTDDWLIIAALAPMTAMAVSTAVGIKSGGGKHILYATDIPTFAKTSIVDEATCSLTSLLIKLSLLFLYWRIFKQRSLLIWSYAIGAVVLLHFLSSIIIIMLQCIPLHALWDRSAGWCMDSFIAFTYIAVLNTITDIAILVLPIRYVLALQMSTGQKYQILGIFGLGGIVCIFGILRIINMSGGSNPDVTWSVVQGTIWSEVEIAVGIICACIPLYRPLFSRAVRRHRAQTIGHELRTSRPSSDDQGKTVHCAEDETYLTKSDEPYSSWPKGGWTERTGMVSADLDKPLPVLQPVPFGQIHVESNLVIADQNKLGGW